MNNSETWTVVSKKQSRKKVRLKQQQIKNILLQPNSSTYYDDNTAQASSQIGWYTRGVAIDTVVSKLQLSYSHVDPDFMKAWVESQIPTSMNEVPFEHCLRIVATYVLLEDLESLAKSQHEMPVIAGQQYQNDNLRH